MRRRRPAPTSETKKTFFEKWGPPLLGFIPAILMVIVAGLNPYWLAKQSIAQAKQQQEFWIQQKRVEGFVDFTKERRKYIEELSDSIGVFFEKASKLELTTIQVAQFYYISSKPELAPESPEEIEDKIRSSKAEALSEFGDSFKQVQAIIQKGRSHFVYTEKESNDIGDAYEDWGKWLDDDGPFTEENIKFIDSILNDNTLTKEERLTKLFTTTYRQGYSQKLVHFHQTLLSVLNNWNKTFSDTYKAFYFPDNSDTPSK